MVTYKYFFAIVLLAGTLLYFGIMSEHFFQILINANYDDNLQIKLAQTLAAGDWLGAYDQLTLSKGITYPLWLAIVHVSDVPLWFANALLYTMGVGMITYAISRVVHNKVVLSGVYLVTLFNPLITMRIYRDSIAPAITLILIAWIIGTILSFSNRPKNGERTRKTEVFIFTLAGLAALPLWWNLREDAFWIFIVLVPAMVVYVCYGIYKLIHKQWSLKRLVSLLIIFTVPFISLYAVSSTISLINQHIYGRYVVNDYISSEFKDAYGALTRIKDDAWQITVPVSTGMREKAYVVSPSFQKLQPCLDNDGKGVCESFKKNHVKISNDDYEGGWFFWSLRLAASEGGYYTNPKKAEGLFKSIASEINRACNTKILECSYGERSSLSPPYRSEIITPLFANIVNSSSYITTLKSTDYISIVRPIPSDTERQATSDYFDVGYSNTQDSKGLDVKQSIRTAIAKLYGFLHPVVFICAIFALLYMTVRRRKYAGYGAVIFVSWILFGVIAARVLTLAYVSTVSFPAIDSLYFSSTYPLLFVVEALVIGVFFIGFKKKAK